MGQAFLAANGGNALGLPVQIHIEAVFVIAADRPQQARDTSGGRIAMGFPVLDHLSQLVDDVLRSGLVGIAHAQIDDIGPFLAQTKFDVIQPSEQIGR